MRISFLNPPFPGPGNPHDLPHYLNSFQTFQTEEAIMKTRSNSARKARPHAAGNRKPRRAFAKLSVTPVAMKPGASRADAVIPVSVKEGGDSAQALIPVEVATTGKSPKKRAAVIPISVQKRSAQGRKRRPRPVKTRMKGVKNRPLEHQQRTSPYPMPWGTFFAKGVNGVLEVQKAGIRLGLEYGRTAIMFVESVLWPFFGRPVDGTQKRGKLLPWETERPAALDFESAA